MPSQFPKNFGGLWFRKAFKALRFEDLGEIDIQML